MIRIRFRCFFNRSDETGNGLGIVPVHVGCGKVLTLGLVSDGFDVTTSGGGCVVKVKTSGVIKFLNGFVNIVRSCVEGRWVSVWVT